MAVLTSEIEGTRALAAVLPLAEFRAAVAAGVVTALQDILPQRRVEALLAREGPSIVARIHTAKAVLATAYCEAAALEAVADAVMTFEVTTEISELGLPRRARWLSGNAKADLPAVGQAEVAFTVRADPAAVARFTEALSTIPGDTPQPANPHGDSSPTPPSAPTASLGCATKKFWKGD